jgi:hypothetical protein
VPLVAGVVLVGAVAVTATVTAETTSAATTAGRHSAASRLTATMPAPTGSYRVGTPSLELVDRSRNEPGSNPTVADAAQRAHVLAFFDYVLNGKTGTGAGCDSVPRRSDDESLTAHSESAPTATKGDCVMNWIRRTWRFVIDRPLV